MKVKLNNPQMGTETFSIIENVSFDAICPVKLNNPQMGTETRKMGCTVYSKQSTG